MFRYQLICPALDKDLSSKARGRIVREIAAKEHTDPFGTSVRYSRDTLDRWIRRYRAGGFVELIPSPRALAPRTDAATLELAAALKRENPARTAARWPASCGRRRGGRRRNRRCCGCFTAWS